MNSRKSERDWFDQTYTVKEVMTRMPSCISPGAPVARAKEVMSLQGIRHLPVLDEGRLLGVVTEKDLEKAEVVQGGAQRPVGETMSEASCVADPNTPLHELVETMLSRKVNYALITGPTGRVIGIFTTQDALNLLKVFLMVFTKDPSPLVGTPK